MSLHKPRSGLILFGLCALLFSGCTQMESENIVSEISAKTELSVGWWGDDIRNEYMLQALSVFAQDHPEIQLSMNYSTEEDYDLMIQARDAASMTCDVQQISYDQLFDPQIQQKFFSLSSIKDFLNFHLLRNDAVSWGQIDDVIYALSNSADIPAFYYNKALLDEYGVPVPATWDELLALGDLCASDNRSLFSAADESFFLLITAWAEQTIGYPMFDEDQQLQYDRDELSVMISLYQQLIDHNVIVSSDSPAREVCSLETVGCISWSSYASSLALSAASANISICTGPLLLDEPDAEFSGWYFRPGVLYVIRTDAEEPREAAKLLRFLINSDTIVQNQALNEGYPVAARSTFLIPSTTFTQTLSGQASSAYQQYKDEFSLIPPVLVSPSVHKSFFTFANRSLQSENQLATLASQFLYSMQCLLA